MGFYSLESIKEDAKRHNIKILNPDINISQKKFSIQDKDILTGLNHVKNISSSEVKTILIERNLNGRFSTLGEFINRTYISRRVLENLAYSGAFDLFNKNRRETLWEIGLRYKPKSNQKALPMPITQDMPSLKPLNQIEKMSKEYSVLGFYPQSHLMKLLRRNLPKYILTAKDLASINHGDTVVVAGVVIRRQHPSTKAIFMTLEDEYGHIPIIIWPSKYENLRHILAPPILIIQGELSKKNGGLNIILSKAKPIESLITIPRHFKNWR